MNGLFNPTQDRFDIFREWLQDLGGSYDYYRPEPEPQAEGTAVYQPAHQITPRPLNSSHYYTDIHGSVRRRSPKRKK